MADKLPPVGQILQEEVIYENNHIAEISYDHFSSRLRRGLVLRAGRTVENPFEATNGCRDFLSGSAAETQNQTIAPAISDVGRREREDPQAFSSSLRRELQIPESLG